MNGGRFGFGDVLRGVERTLSEALALRAYELPMELSSMDGSFRDAKAHLEARAYRGAGVRLARFVWLEGDGLEIANAIVFSSIDRAVPSLGIDLVAVGRDTAVVVADLSPVTDDVHLRAAHARVLERHRGAGGFPSTEASPSWASAWLSPQALVARVPWVRRDAVARTLQSFADAFIELVTTEAAPARDASAGAVKVASAQDAYCASHRQDDRGLRMLPAIFGASRAERFVRYVLFPERLPS